MNMHNTATRLGVTFLLALLIASTANAQKTIRAAVSPTTGPAAPQAAKSFSATLGAINIPPVVESPRGAAQRPVLIATVLNPQQRSELQEDLAIMSKLVGEAMAGSAVYGDFSAMGIAVARPAGRTEVMYVEGCGVIITTSVALTLAGSNAATTRPSTVPTSSAWERARRELNGELTAHFRAHVDLSSGSGSIAREFDQARLDQFISGINGLLLEARNIRRLDPDEFVFISVSGFDDNSRPVRLTAKARKSVIDAAATKGTKLNALVAVHPE